MKNDERAKQVVEETYRQNNQKRHLLDVLAILSTVEGRRFIIELLGACRVFKNNWTPSAEIHRFEGMRHIGLTVPPQASTQVLTIASPSPTPPKLRLREDSGR